ncbi:hypothetical protein [Myxococcus stipitatus]|uniref:toxin-antitoxin system YwqK family antitoxin n=1 Tax=Myxococcus stipitatus TaxID=83455 RepID=UPI0030D29B08
MSFRLAAFGLTVIASHALAQGSSSEREVRLNCPSGTIQQERRMGNDSGVFCVKEAGADKGRHHGPYLDFWANGQKQSEGQYKDGFRTGRWVFYDTNGLKTGETEFESNDYHGKRVQYYPSGAKKQEQTWVKGKREGVEVSYSEGGQKISEVRYSADKPMVAQ